MYVYPPVHVCSNSLLLHLKISSPMHSPSPSTYAELLKNLLLSSSPPLYTPNIRWTKIVMCDCVISMICYVQNIFSFPPPSIRTTHSSCWQSLLIGKTFPQNEFLSHFKHQMVWEGPRLLCVTWKIFSPFPPLYTLQTSYGLGQTKIAICVRLEWYILRGEERMKDFTGSNSYITQSHIPIFVCLMFGVYRGGGGREGDFWSSMCICRVGRREKKF